jgi:hypothetical protein
MTMSVRFFFHHLEQGTILLTLLNAIYIMKCIGENDEKNV